MVEATQRGIYLDDLMTGLFAAMAQKGIDGLSLRKNILDKAMAKLYQNVTEEAVQNNLRVRFQIHTHPAFEDSIKVKQEVYNASGRKLISIDNPEFEDLTLKIDPYEAHFYLDKVPGSPDMYRRLAEKLIQYYREAITS